jgi:hypothetical protein
LVDASIANLVDAGSIPNLVVQRAHLDPEAAFLECRIPGETLTLLVTRVGKGLRLGVLPGKSRPGEAKKRVWLESARVLGKSGEALVLMRAERTLHLVAEARGLLVVPRPDDAPEIVALDLDALRAAGFSLRDGLLARRFDVQKAAVTARLGRAVSRLSRRAERILGDLDKLAALDQKAALAPLFLAEAARAARGQKALVATDWTTGSPVEVTFPLDPAKAAQEQLEAVFRRAKRAKAGRAIAERRWEDATLRVEALRALLPSVQSAQTDADLGELVRQAKAAAPKDFGDAVPTRSRDPQARAAPYREYAAQHGEPIYVGRGGEHNDALTFGVARPHDLWLHTKDWPGAHVVVPMPKNKSVAQHVLLDAAELAAHFSEAAGEAVIAVQIAERRHLRKPRGSPKGFVVVGKEKVLELRPEAERLARLLATAEAT